jgi:PAS domain S-box-containing protein
MLVPLIARGQLLAVLSIAARDGSRTYGPADLRLAMELARRAALTLDNVQLFQQSLLQGAMTTNLAEGAVLLRAADRAIVYANPRFARMFGFPLHELLGVRIATLSSSLEAAHTRMTEQLDHSAHWHDEIECARNDGTHFWCSVSVSNFDHQEHGRVWIALFTDITERKSLEERTARAMQEKDVLLKEIHHRVKNNLQVISSLFSLQRERTHSLELKSLLSESQTRVESIALVHEQLYRSADLAAIDFDEYLRSLLAAIRSSYGADQLQTEISAKNVLLDVERAVPCALLVCELVSNSIKHAFGAAPGKVWVRVRQDRQGGIVLEVGDDGRGMPPDFDWRKTRALGLRLVQSLARQLRATIVVERSPGTRFILTFAGRTSKAAAPHANFMATSAAR